MTKKIDILVKNSPGFAVNRFFAPLMNESFRILEEGIANIPTIDKAAMDLLGIGMGTFLLVNVTGVPISYHTQNTLFEKLGIFYKPANVLLTQFESGENWPLDGGVEEDKMQAVKDRLLGSIFYTTTSLFDEGVADIKDIDIGAMVGLRWAKGPFEIMNDLGIEKSSALVENVPKPFPDLEIPQVLKAQMEKGEPWPI